MGQLALADESLRVPGLPAINGGSNRERLAAAPVVADNKLFVVDVDATVNAFAADGGGTKLWSAALLCRRATRTSRHASAAA